MGKKNRLSLLINKWIKSDLPDDDLSTTVLLLGVTRIPTSPAPTRRSHTSYPSTQNNPFPYKSKTRKNSIGSGKRNPFKSRKNINVTPRNSIENNGTVVKVTAQKNNDDERKRKSQFLNKLFASSIAVKRNSFRGITDNSCYSFFNRTTSNNDGNFRVTTDEFNNSNVLLNDINDFTITTFDFDTKTIMDRSVDSIGACSLDMGGSVKYTDQSDHSSTATLKSVRLSTKSPQPEPHLPSYLSLACTVNGYSTTTNYNSERLSKSRDASPHRFLEGDLTLAQDDLPENPTVRNNLLSPPTVVPLPIRKQYQQEASGSTKVQTMSHHEFLSTSSRISTYESKKTTYMGHYTSKCLSGVASTSNTTTAHYVRNTQETENKSFIQQRVERLYGPGALAQGFFISKRLQGRSFEAPRDNVDLNVSVGRHSTSFDESTCLDESSLKQSTSSPTLPVLRHLRPEFRAQLPIISPKKCLSSSSPKNNVFDNFKADTNKNKQLEVVTNGTKLNGHALEEDKTVLNSEKVLNGKFSGLDICGTSNEETVKDGHYFLKILDTETERLIKLADRIEKDLENLSLSEEIKGKLRSASGKARLLTSQKMQQFRGLCTNNISRREDEAFPTTNEDLRGFWDMVLLQVDQVNEIFREIDQLRANNWVEVVKSEDVVDKKGIKKTNGFNGVAKTSKKVVHPTKSVANRDVLKQRDALRKQMIEAKRKAMKEQQKNNDNIQIFVPESS